MFEHIERTDRLLMFINVLLLMVVAFVPFATTVLAASFRNGTGEPVAVAPYGGVLVLAGLCFNWIWSHSWRAKLMDEHVTDDRMRRMTRRILFGPASYAVGGIVGYFLPVAGVVIFAVLILFYWLPTPQRDRGGALTGIAR